MTEEKELQEIHLSCSNSIDFTNDQYEALNTIAKFKESTDLFFLLVGNAGTGKTTIAENIAKYMKAQVLAPTNTAVNRLKEKFCDNTFREHNFKTIHQQLYGFPDRDGTFTIKKDKGFATKGTYIIDEVSMIDESLLKDIIKEAEKKKAKVIFIGDDFQLEPVGKDPKLFSKVAIEKLFNNNYYKLNEVMRNGSTILSVATYLRRYDTPFILDINNKEFSRVNNFTDELGYNIENDDDYIVLVSTNKKRIEYNDYIRKYRYKDDYMTPVLDKERVISVSNLIYTNGECYTLHRPVVKCIAKESIIINNYGKQVKKTYEFYLVEHEDNKGNPKTTLLIPDLDLPSLHKEQLMNSTFFNNNPLFAKYSSKQKKFIWRNEINIATYAYAISVHKSQGNEWDHVYINSDWLSDSWNKSRWYYTAITRAKKTIELKISNNYQIK
jgi:tRNA A37 threonylcarbamoyladenosine biosynthesis protein TsaE